MTPIVVLKAAASLAQRAVRRWLERPPAAAASPSLTIGAVLMTDHRETPVVPGVPATRRSLAYAAVLQAARELLVARFALTRALDKLTTEEILQVLDEVDETTRPEPRLNPWAATTPRNEK